MQRQNNNMLRESLTELNQEIAIRIRSHYEAKWHQKIRKAERENKNVWHMIKQRKRENTENRITTLKHNGREYNSTEENIELLATTYQETANITENLSDDATKELIAQFQAELQTATPQTPAEAQTTPTEISKITRGMRPYKAPGEDNMQPKLLKSLPKKMIVQIYYIIKECLNRQVFPNNTVVIPIKKPKKNPDSPASYRPITLLPCLEKILERTIHHRLTDAVEEENIIKDEQFGFVKNRSTTLQLARIIDKARTNFNLNKITKVTILDLEKA